MRNRKNIPVAKLIRLSLTRGQQLAQQILPIHTILAALLPLLELRQCDTRDEGVLGREERHVLPQRISPEKIVEEGHLAHDAVVPLRIVDSFDAAVNIDAGG